MKISSLYHRSVWLPLICLPLLAGCGEPPPESIPEVARPVKSMLVSGPEGGSLRKFPGRIDSANKAELSFRVAGKVQKLAVKEGENVSKDQLLAQLDQTEYRLALQDKQAVYDRTEKNFDRARELVESGSISQRDYDRIDADFKSADAALEQALQNLNYTYLKAPFSGSVARRHVEAFEEVKAKQTVFSMIDQSSLLVKFDLPESLILHLPQGSTVDENQKNIPVTASFDAVTDEQFPLTFKEVSKRADAKTQTFEVTYSLPQQKKLMILPGMTANVTVDLSAVLAEDTVHYLPVTAVTANSGLEARVWRVDEETMTVHEQKVSVGRLLGSSIEITGGLASGTRIVTAGAAYLAEGMKVTLMAEVEQAEPRPDVLPSTDQQ
jgi:RND family efflux transporter MFP subunit